MNSERSTMSSLHVLGRVLINAQIAAAPSPPTVMSGRK